MDILYIGSFPPSFLIKRSGGRIDSLYRDSQPLIKGLRNHDGINLKVITSPDVISYPQGPLFIKREYDCEENLTLVSSLNISLVKQIWTIVSMTIEAAKQIRKCSNKVIVIVPYVVFRHVATLRLLRLLFPSKVIQVCVVPDIFFPKGKIKKAFNRITERMAARFDYYVLYTKKMAEHLNVPKDKYIVIEGFRDVPNRKQKKDSTAFKIVYAGLLNICYGIGRLVDAMKYIDDPTIQLHLYGSGDGQEIINNAIELDNRIYYHGRVSNSEATDAIYSASVLVNPRNATDGQYVDYSFPSKDIEYLSTGIPTLLCVLPGMPPEYFGYFVDIKDGQPEQIAQGILHVKNMDDEQRRDFGERARSFIVERMDCNRQASQIISLINKSV